MNEQELRTLVREAVARHLSGRTDTALSVGGIHSARHPSHELLVVATGADMGGPCVIEPAVMCNHCGYCKSYGH